MLNYGALHGRYRNSVQQEAVDEYVTTLARPLFDLAREEGSIMTHGCHNNQDFDFAASDDHDIDNGHPLVYFAHPQHKSGLLFCREWRLACQSCQ